MWEEQLGCCCCFYSWRCIFGTLSCTIGFLLLLPIIKWIMTKIFWGNTSQLIVLVCISLLNQAETNYIQSGAFHIISTTSLNSSSLRQEDASYIAEVSNFCSGIFTNALYTSIKSQEFTLSCLNIAPKNIYLITRIYNSNTRPNASTNDTIIED